MLSLLFPYNQCLRNLLYTLFAAPLPSMCHTAAALHHPNVSETARFLESISGQRPCLLPGGWCSNPLRKAQPLLCILPKRLVVPIEGVVYTMQPCETSCRPTTSLH